MRTLILYYSATGNTRQMAEYLHHNIKESHLCSLESPIPGKDWRKIVLACPTQYLDVPQIFLSLWDKLSLPEGIPGYGINSYSVLSGRTRSTLKKMLQGKGLIFQGSRSMAWPESYPPYLCKGILQEEEPSDRQWGILEDFSKTLQKGEVIPDRKESLFDKLIHPPSLKKRRKQCFPLQWDSEKCRSCGSCLTHCPWQALGKAQGEIHWNPGACMACWRCYNRCPNQAISSGALKHPCRYGGKKARITSPVDLPAP